MGMEGVGFLGSIIIGLIAGYVAERITRSDHGFLTNIFLGVLGAVVMGWLARRLGFTIDGFAENLVGAIVGAFGLITIYQWLKRS
ncbi:GlsB/YeaQ/YmgE family stress response membrane protein [Chthonobacter rhizosphaerae]|uniref:GlsB/YeaQ/YmgE family stress response membrane protein n=1 Tax=Chthonobacter rhizosphaerae TaxID=2735553 RepID=UPI0015EE5D7A|nr:GlsB/YeaQ/YmgE family stress response membrane protein [Chthonobacter rhizosphaerae]